MTTSEKVTHDVKNKTPGQKRKLRQKIIEGFLKDKPGVIANIVGHPEEGTTEQLWKRNSGHSRKMGLLPIHRSNLPQNAGLGHYAVLVSRKRDGRFNG